MRNDFQPYSLVVEFKKKKKNHIGLSKIYMFV